MTLNEYLSSLGIAEDKIKEINTTYVDTLIAKKEAVLTAQIEELKKSSNEQSEKLSEYTKKEREALISKLAKEHEADKLVKFAGITPEDDENTIKEKLVSTKKELETTFKQPEPEEPEGIETNKKTSKDEASQEDEDLKDL